MGLTTGIRALDDLVGGLRAGDNFVLEAEEGTSPDALAHAFVRAAARSRLVYVSFHVSPAHLLERLSDVWEPERYVLVDCFTDGLGRGEDTFTRFYRSKRRPIAEVIRVGDAAEPGAARAHLGRVQQELGDRVLYLFDSLTGMQALWGPRPALDVFLSTCPRLFDMRTVAYWLLERPAHDASFLAQIHHTTQVAVALRADDDVQVLQVLRGEARPPQIVGSELRFRFLDTGRVRVVRDDSHERARIGHLLRSRRMARRLTLGEVARLAGISASALSQAERGQAGVSAATLTKLSDILGLDSLHERDVDPHSVTREGGRSLQTLGGGVTAEALAESRSGSKLFLLRCPPMATGPAPFATKREELVYLVAGRLVLQIGEREVALAAGDAMPLVDEPIRAWRNPGSEEARVVWVLL